MPISRYFKYIDLLIFPIAAFYLVYLFTSYSGIGVSPDSIMYTSAARSLHATGSLTTFNNTPITDFPVFYPFFLWIELVITGIDPIKAGPFLDGLLFATTLFLSGWIIERFRPNSWLYKWLMLTAIVLSPALLQVYTYLWSETLFITIILFFIIACRQYFTRHTFTSLLILAFVAALSSITRYAGVTLIGTGGLLLLMDRALILKKKVQHIIIYGIVASSLLALNLVRNIMVTGRLTGPREASFTPFIKNVYYFGTVMCDWLGFSAKAYPFATLITALLFAALIGMLVYNYLKKQVNSYENLVVAFTFVYGAFIIISSTFSRYERINSRLLSPLFITLLLSCTWWAITAVKKTGPKLKYVTTSFLVIIILGFIYVEAFSTTMNSSNSIQGALKRYEDENEFGIPGYTDDSWNKSEFATYLKKSNGLFKQGVPVYSDANEALYFLSGAKVKLLPHRYFNNDIQKFYQLKHYYLVWFNQMDNPELISLKDIIKVKNLKLLKKFTASTDEGIIDGAIYEYNGE
ncbi:MAG: hypothetical protein JWR67_1696 [Mucilaginibacter sp.]|nr:hypothetical protein [Mucilaginibacter sp.]